MDLPLPELVRRQAEQLLLEFCERRVPHSLRNEYRLAFQVRGNTVTLYELHAPWHPALPKWSRTPSAQFRYDSEAQVWVLYWPDRNCRWHLYDDMDPTPDLTTLLTEVHTDPTGIFFG